MNNFFADILRVVGIFSICLFFSPLSAQKERNIWYFGGASNNVIGAGIDFNTTPPTLLTNSVLGAGEGSASIADPTTGKLLFYTQGEVIYNRNHQPMPNGVLKQDGAWSATQSSIIIPKPCSTNQYYLFYMSRQDLSFQVPNNIGVAYSLVDMTLNGGLGDVVSGKKDIPVSGTNNVAEKLMAIKHANGQDYWLIYHEYLRSGVPTSINVVSTSKFKVCLVTATGISLPTTHSAGTPYFSRRVTGVPTINPTVLGYLKPSHDCSMLAAAIHGTEVKSFTGAVLHPDQATVDVLNFNNTTGAITSKYSLTGLPTSYGVEFSPDNTKLYVVGKQSGKLFQFDLSAGSPAAIQATQTLLFSFSTPPDGGGGALQLAPDGKIYMARTGTTPLNYLGVINNPNAAGTSCNFVEKGFMLGGHFSSQGLPNFYQSCATAGATLTADFNMVPGVCNYTTTVNYNNTSTATGSATYYWDLGDGTSSSSKTPPTHTYPVGSYLVTLTVKDGCKSVEISKAITITAPPFTISAGNDTTLECGTSVNLTATVSDADTYTYEWSNGQITPTISVDTTGTYIVLVDDLIGCKVKDTVIVTMKSMPVVNLGPDIALCDESGVVLDAGASFQGNYLWSTGSTDKAIIVSSSDIYWVKIVSGLCTAIDSVEITEQPGFSALFVPNSFTPNKDGLNDNFLVKGEDIPEFDLKVFNRWGQLLFQTNNVNKGWDGTYNSNSVQEDIYVWMVKYKSTCGGAEKIVHKIGHLSLIR